ncbi:hypothetical protein Agub_g6372, partial [Astrephomene gubernaculifera]
MAASNGAIGLAAWRLSPAPWVPSLHPRASSVRRASRSGRRKQIHEAPTVAALEASGSRARDALSTCRAHHFTSSGHYAAFLRARNGVVTHASNPSPGADGDASNAGSSNGGIANGVKVTLVVPKGPLPPGQQLVLVGGHSLLGGWEPQRGVRLEYGSSGTAHTAELVLPTDTP